VGQGDPQGHKGGGTRGARHKGHGTRGAQGGRRCHSTAISDGYGSKCSQGHPGVRASLVHSTLRTGNLGLPGKNTAVVGICKADKTTFLHQIHRKHINRGTTRERLPYIDFEDKHLGERVLSPVQNTVRQ